MTKALALIEPLTPPDCDLTDYDWFPLQHKRLRRSSFWVNASDTVKASSVELWCEAYEQIPAASLPDDDAFLAQATGFGRRNVRGWLEVKDEVMAAWIKASDGRWYHPTLAEIANAAWVRRKAELERREDERRRKAEYRAQKEGKKPPQKSLKKSPVSHGTNADVPRDSDLLSDEYGDASDGHPPENALKGTGTETSEEASSEEDVSADADATARQITADMQKAFEAFDEMSMRNGLTSQPVKRNEARRKAMKTRLRSLASEEDPGGLEAWRALVARAAASDFCMGRTDNDFRVGIDNMLRPSFLTKLAEGKYDNRRPAHGSGQQNSGTGSFGRRPDRTEGLRAMHAAAMGSGQSGSGRAGG